MKRLDNFIKDQEVRPLTPWQCNALCGGAWSEGGKKKDKGENENEKKVKELKIDSETLLATEFQLEDKSLVDPAGQCPHM